MQCILNKNIVENEVKNFYEVTKEELTFDDETKLKKVF